MSTDLRTEGVDRVQYALYERPSVAVEINNAIIYGPHAIPRLRSGELVQEVIADRVNGLAQFVQGTINEGGLQDLINLSSIGSAKPQSSEDCLMSLVRRRENKDIAYGHWLLDELPKLQAARLYERDRGVQPTLLLDSNPAEWQLDLLRYLGYQNENWIEWDKTVLKVDNLVVPPLKEIGFHKEPNYHGYRWVRNNLEQKVDYERYLGSFSNKVILSRQGTSRRRIKNFDEIFNELKKYGFKKYRPEEKTIAEQIAMFKQADIVVGTTGSALANVIFADKLRLIELFPPDFFFAVFYELAQIVGAEYFCEFGDEYVRSEVNLNPKETDFYISPEKIANKVKSIQQKHS
jgi:hypothetical protein